MQEAASRIQLSQLQHAFAALLSIYKQLQRAFAALLSIYKQPHNASMFLSQHEPPRQHRSLEADKAHPMCKPRPINYSNLAHHLLFSKVPCAHKHCAAAQQQARTLRPATQRRQCAHITQIIMCRSLHIRNAQQCTAVPQHFTLTTAPRLVLQAPRAAAASHQPI